MRVTAGQEMSGSRTWVLALRFLGHLQARLAGSTPHRVELLLPVLGRGRSEPAAPSRPGAAMWKSSGGTWLRRLGKR